MKFYIADCFAEEKYQGNELLVVIADRFVSDREQQQIAREINFSETAFILSGKQDLCRPLPDGRLSGGSCHRQRQRRFCRVPAAAQLFQQIRH
ncbi:MAG: PhzF family phenazine biosynthesis protein [Acidaminococcaceae bacterium]|nr:PhzF family phenazine biosynthesis protein [Acidaminococcaceae bacterium]